MPGRLVAVVAGLVVVLALLVALVHTGKLTRIDQFGDDHLMPTLDPGEPARGGHAGLWRPFAPGTNWWSKILALWTYPCSVLISGLVVAALGLVLWRLGRRYAALLPPAAWVVGNGVEVVGKHFISRPALYGLGDGIRLHVTNFDHSFPSGHMIRGVLIAGAVALAWPRPAPWIALWACLVGPVLVVQAAHTPSDVVGGALVGLIVVLLGWALLESPWGRRWFASG
jgi:membrane-associated phospholipid phosphatase